MQRVCVHISIFISREFQYTNRNKNDRPSDPHYSILSFLLSLPSRKRNTILTPTPFTYRGYFSLDKRFGNRIQIKNISLWNVQFVSRFNTAFAIKRGASQQSKQVILREDGREREGKKNYQQRVCPYSKKNVISVLKKLPSTCGLEQQFQGLGHSFSLYGPPSWQITY